jgi:prepilin-type N-terminal cleavage/methylation domain-containing protein
MLSDEMKNQRGFTIVELTVALSVSAMVLATGYELFKTLRFVGERQDQSMVELWGIIDVLSQIREDLVHAVPKTYGQEAMFAGDNATFEFEEFKLLQFYSLVTGQFNEVCGIRYIHRIEYGLVKEKDSICLYRTAMPAVGANKQYNNEKRKIIFSKIEDLSILFHNGERLETSFSSKQSLPVYVVFKFTAYGQTWPLTVKLPCGLTNMEQQL